MAEPETRQFFGRRRSHRSWTGRDNARDRVPITGANLGTDPDEPADKLGTFDGVFVPTTLNVLSVLMFLRFGFLLGQAGVLGLLFLLALSYAVNLLTTLSVSAIATNGTVKGGGAYYMISRSLGPEFGGSIGIVFFIGQILNTGMNVVGFFEPIVANFGVSQGVLANVVPEDGIWVFVYCTILLIVCSALVLVGSHFFARSGGFLLILLTISVVSIPISALVVQPYVDTTHDAIYTGLSLRTLASNLMPGFTNDAAGSEISGTESLQDIFAILFPATSGILAGASMSGSLRRPSHSIPKGTLWGLLATFCTYALVIVTIGSCVSRELLYRDVQILQSMSISPYLILLGELSTSLFSATMGITGAANLLEAISRDDLIPYSLRLFGTGSMSSQLNAVALSYALTQVTLLFDINQIAAFITMAFLMTFVVTNLACFLLKIASAPNFRPSFRYFTTMTAFCGVVASTLAMFIADGMSASVMVMVLVALFGSIHYWSPPKPWGDVSQTLIYHQVRKYLLRLRQDHVKFWRPQILLLVDDPRSCWSLIHFCNHLKKGGLYVLGHVMVTHDDFQAAYPEIKRTQQSWAKLRVLSNVKGFVQIAASPSVVWGVRNVYLGSGLGGMKPNITVLGFYGDHIRVPDSSLSLNIEPLPTDTCRKEPTISVTDWVNVVEDLLTMQSNLAIAKGFPHLQFPSAISNCSGYIDLYPIQMAAQIVDEQGNVSGLSTNFDTYSLILQMGAILKTVPAWKKCHVLRVVVFVEYEHDVAEERARVQLLLEKLRIRAETLVLCLNSGDIGAYDTIIHGEPDHSGRVTKYLGSYDWWQELQRARQELVAGTRTGPVQETTGQSNVITISRSNQNKPMRARRHTVSDLNRLGVSLSIHTGSVADSHGLYEDDRWSESDSSESASGSDADETETLMPFKRPNFERMSSQTSSLHRRVASLRKTASSEPVDHDLSRTQSPLTEDPHSTPRPQSATQPLRPHLMKTLSHSNSAVDISKAKKLRPNFTGSAIPQTRVVDGVLDGDRTIMFEDTPVPSRNHFLGSFLSFNDLPAKAQHMILNDMMHQTSSRSTVIFTTLPAPSPGTCKNQADSEEYVESLELWCRDLPPVMLLHSQTMTVTTAL